MEMPLSKLSTPTANTDLSADGEPSIFITAGRMSKQHKRRPLPPSPSRKADNVMEVRLSGVYRFSKSAMLVVLAIMLVPHYHHRHGNNIQYTVDASTVSAIPTHRRQDDERNTMNHQSTLGSPTPFVRATRCFLRDHHDPADLLRFIQFTTRRGQATLAHSIPALSVYSRRKDDAGRKRSRRDLNNGISDRELVEVAVKQKQPSKDGNSGPRSLPNPVEITSTFFDHAGFYDGIDTKTISKHSKGSLKRPRKPKLQDTMTEALEELRILRQEMERMRQEVHTLKLKMVGEDEEELSAVQPDSEEVQARKRKMLRKKQKEAERLAADIESWAQQILQEGEEEGWKQVECNKMIRGSLNEGERTSAYVKWMKDSRADKANPDDDTEYPCIKCYSTIDAPLEDVCTYLSQEAASAEYNDVVKKHKDVEEISPSAKICWTQSPQILFIKPRDFVTFCHHRWKKDGTEIIVNQACDHPNFPLEKMDKEGKSCRGYALRGANFLSRCPEDPSKTQIVIIAHANPGGDLPQWAAKTAVNALAPIEPFKLFHKINENVKRNQPQIRERLAEAEMVSNVPPGRTPRPGGIAQLGYACFWPKGGGIVEGGAIHQPSSPTSSQTEGDNDVAETEKTGPVTTKNLEHEHSDSLTSEMEEASLSGA